MEKNGIEGFVFFVEVSILYIIDSVGNICLLNGEYEKIQEFQENEYYYFKNLFFIKKENIYSLYDITQNTTYNLLKGRTFFKQFAIIKFIVLDILSQDKNVELKLISGSSEKLYFIKNQIQFISLLRNDESTYFLQIFRLIINNKHKDFSFFIYKGFINSINCGLNEDNLNKNKSYEIIYLSKEIKDMPIYLQISNYIISAYDKFNCTNRRRFNIMNVKSDNKIYKYNTDLTSLEVIYLINKNNKITKYGVFDINSHKEKKIKNYVFDNEIEIFVNKFYDEYDFNIKTQRYTKGYFNRKNEAIKNTSLYSKLMDNKLIFINDYSIKSLDNEKAFIFFRNYYFFLFLNYLKGKNIWNKYMEYFNLLDELNAENYGNYTKIRIITDFIQNILLYELIPTFMNINTLDKNDPYRLAIEFQKQIISNIKETSNIFYPIIQFNSKILKILPDNIWDIFKNKIKSLFHKIIKEEYAYTISLEDLTDMRSHLLSLQEDFFFYFLRKK